MRTLYSFTALLILLTSSLSLLKAEDRGMMVCPPGDITLTTQQQVDDFVIDYPACTQLLGNLVIGPSTDIMNLNGLSVITDIAQGLFLQDNPMLNDVTGLNALLSIGASGGPIDIRDNGALTTFDLSAVSAPNLTYVSILRNDVLTDACLPSDITTLSGNYNINLNPLLVNLCPTDNLISVGGSLGILNVIDPDLPDFPNLTSIDQGIIFRFNSQITQLPAFNSLTNINGGAIDINDNDLLTDFDLSAVSAPNLTYAQVLGNAVLTDACLPSDITTLSGNYSINLNPLLVNLCPNDNLISVGGSFNILNTIDPDLPDFPKLTTIDQGIVFRFNSQITELPAFNSLTNINGGPFDIQDNDLLADFDLSAVSAPNLTYIFIFQNAILTDACLPSDITTLSSNYNIQQNPLLTNICPTDNLTSVGGAFNILDVIDPDLPDFPNLVNIDQGIALRDNSQITELPAFNSLTNINGGPIDIQRNNLLPDFDLSAVSAPNLTYIFIFQNAILTDACLPSDITTLGGSYNIQANPLLANLCPNDNLTSVGGAFNILDVIDPDFPDFPNLVSIDQGIALRDNSQITELPAFNSLTHINGGPIDIQRNDMLLDFDLSAVSAPDLTYVQVDGNDVLTSMILPTDITTLSNYFFVKANPLLSFINDQDNLISIGQFLNISNTILCELPDFPNLQSIGGSPATNDGIVFESNSNITELKEFPSLTFLEEFLRILNNPVLSDCAIQAVCDNLPTLATIEISGNAGDCLDQAAVQNHCDNGPTIPPPITFPPDMTVTQGGSVTLSITNLPAGYDAVWYAPDMTTIIYQDVANAFQYQVNSTITLYGSYAPQGSTCYGPLEAVVLTAVPLVFSASNETTGVNGNAAVQFTVDNFTDVNSFQFSINWDPTNLTYTSNQNLTLPPSFIINAAQANLGILSVSWFDSGFDGETYPSGTAIFEVNFTANVQGTHPISITCNPVAIEASDNNSNLLTVETNNGSVDVICGLDVTCPPPGQVNLECISELPAGPTTVAEFNALGGVINDSCNPVDISFADNDDLGPGCVGAARTVIRTITVTDPVTSETVDCPITYVFEDVTPPTITCPGPLAVECIEDVPPADVTLPATGDNCLAPVVVTHEGDVSDGLTCPETITRTYRATDACGNFVECDQIITVNDTTNPTIVCPGPLAVECIEDIPPADITLPMTGDNCIAAVTVTHEGDVSDGNTCPETITRTYRVTDACGNFAECTQLITVNDITPPVFDQSPLPGPLTVECDAISAPAVLTATDNCLSAAPVLFINEIHYDDSGADQGEFIEIAGTAGIDLSAYELAVYEADGLLDDIRVLSGIIPDEGNGYGAIAFFLADLSSQFFENGPSEGRALIETGVGVPDFISYEGTVTANNGPAAGMTSTDIGVSEPSTTPAGQSLQQTGAGCTAGSFTWVGPLAPDSPGFLNAGQTIDPAQCVISNSVTVLFNETITPGNCPQESTITRTWSAADACGNPVSHTQVITVEDNTAPVFCTLPTDITVDCEAPPAEDMPARDNCDFGGLTGPVWINEVHYDNTGVDVGEFIEIAGVAGTNLAGYQLVAYDSDDLLDDIRVISGVIPDEDCGFGAIAFFLGDLSSQFFENGPEEGRALVDPSGKVLDFISYEGVVNAANGPAAGMTSLDIGTEPTTTPVGQSLQLVRTPGGGPGFAWIGPADDSPGFLNENQAGLLLGVLDEVDNTTVCDGGTVTRTWTIEDACGNMGIPHTQVITVLPPPPPVITCPADQTVECIDDFVLDPSTATATSLCGTIVAIYIKNPLINGVPNCDGTIYTYIYVAVDDCGRTSECEQQVLIDNDPATITVPAGGTVTCFEDIDISLDDATVNGACADFNLYLVPPVASAAVGCPGTTYTFVYRMIDACGRTVEEPVVFTNAANAGPTIVAPADLTTDCLGAVNPNPDNAIVTTSCGAGSTVTVAGPQISGPLDCNNTFYRYTYTVTDDCGRTATDTQDFTVANDPPIFENCPDDNWLVLNCEDYGGEGGTIAVIEAWIASVTASTSCGVPLTVFNNFNSNNINTCVNNGYNTVTFRATDACGRTTFCTGVYVVVDTEAPIITTPAQDHWEMCSYNTQANLTAWVQAHGNAVAYDGCSNDNISWQASPANPQINCIGASGTTTVTVQFIVTDNCGNKTNTTATFNALAPPGFAGEDNEETNLVPESTDRIDLFQNQPNPFKNETLIGFYLPQDMEATLVIFDISGKEVKRISGDYAKGYNTLVINRSELNATGFLLYQLKTELGSMTKRMIMMER